ncbi:MAG: hypothetical protein GDA42_13300 [Ekhidna sp.]|nr:hypothetical protein [Ekhidna sp.]
MEKPEYKSKIVETVSEARSFSFSEKKESVMDEEMVNTFLDAILDFKSKMKGKSEKIFGIIERMEGLTWFTSPDEESLMLLNDLISVTKDIHSSLIRQYAALTPLRKKGIAPDEIKCFKSAIDDLKECYQDLESVFFFLPEMPEFVETTKQLSLV